MSKPSTFDAFIAHQDGCVVLKVRGEVDIGAAPAFDAVISQAVVVSRHVEFDMADVTFLDSTGVRSIIRAWSDVQDDGSVTIRNAPDNVRRVFTVAGIDRLVAFATDTGPTHGPPRESPSSPVHRQPG